MKSKQYYADGIPIPTDYNTHFGYCYAIIRIPNSVSWRAIIRGLIYPLTRYYTWRLDREIAHDTVKQGKVIFNSLEFTCMLDHNLTEINYTLKHILATLSNRATIDTHIAKPDYSYNQDGSINHSVNNSISVNDKSVFKVESLLEENNISEILQIALLDDNIAQLPDLNPFNLESKIDTINTNIEQHNTILNYFSQAFYGGVSSDFNPLSSENFFTRFSKTFNSLNFLGMIDKSLWDLHKATNQNIAISFNESYNNDTLLASNSYFRALHNALTVTLIEIRDCICNLDMIGLIGVLERIRDTLGNALFSTNSEIAQIPETSNLRNLTLLNESVDNNATTIATAISGIQFPDNSQCCDNLSDIASAIREGNEQGTTTVDNGDNTYTTRPIPKEPIEIPNSNGQTDTPYSPNVPLNNGANSSSNAICGYVYHTLDSSTQFLNSLQVIGDSVSQISQATGILSALDYALGSHISFGGIYLEKMAKSSQKSFISSLAKISNYASVLEGLYNEAIEAVNEIKEATACGVAQQNYANLNSYMISSFVLNLVTRGIPQEVANAYGYLLGEFMRYNNVDISEDYAQYCPCPTLTGDWTGLWRGMSYQADFWQLEQDGNNITGYGEIQDGNNPNLIYHCTLVDVVVATLPEGGTRIQGLNSIAEFNNQLQPFALTITDNSWSFCQGDGVNPRQFVR